MKSAVCLLIFPMFSFVSNAATAPTDSVGMEKRGGQLFIIHEVEERETAYALSRRYGVGVEEIYRQNPGTDQGVGIGQRLYIPYQKPSRQRWDLTHTVREGETLYGISRKYGLSAEEVKKINGLKDNGITVGDRLKIKLIEGNASASKAVSTQNNSPKATPETPTKAKVHIVEAGQGLYSIAKMYHVSQEDLMRFNGMKDPSLRIGQKLYITDPSLKPAEDASAIVSWDNGEPQKEDFSRSQEAATIPVNPAPTHTTKVRDFKEVEEEGLAEAIVGSEDTRKYLALHKTAKVGTVLRVRNEMNHQEVFVRVLGKLPATEAGSNVIIRLSKAAYDRLGAIDKRFRVKISYIP